METTIEKLFYTLDKGASVYQEEFNITYLEALAEIGENMYQQSVPEELPNTSKNEIQGLLDQMPGQGNVTNEEYRRALQLAVLKGMKEGTQPHHAMTPDAIGIFVGFLANKVLAHEPEGQTAVILDPAVGAGNLLNATINQVNRKCHGIGADPDETLIKIAFVSANLQGNTMDLFHQDSVATPLVNNVDLVVSDLPVGYYPNEDIAKQFKLRNDGGKSFVHHLLMEQAMNHVKPGGFLIFIVPNFIFETEEAKALHTFLKEEGIIYSLMELPKTLFKTSSMRKSILIVRKKKEEMQNPRQALMVELPSFSNETALRDMTQKISNWFDEFL
ncbi:MAG: class I SAM-dependent methyltransferase [Bacillus sp. (in: Bacteria)]|nr:class I SAM-dependent methyltransferase [Bacillus sp. (in: firmicutes)]